MFVSLLLSIGKFFIPKKEIRCLISADNGCYIGEFPTSNGGKEWRAIEAQAIDNVDYGTPEEQDHSRVAYFGGAKSFASFAEAYEEAERLYNEVMESFGICEYGICNLVFDRPLISKTVKEAEEWLTKHWKEIVIAGGGAVCGNKDCNSTISFVKDLNGKPWFCSFHCEKQAE